MCIRDSFMDIVHGRRSRNAEDLTQVFDGRDLLTREKDLCRVPDLAFPVKHFSRKEDDLIFARCDLSWRTTDLQTKIRLGHKDQAESWFADQWSSRKDR